ncbi:MFS transporter [Dapis sp. BLCC M126]|uniref:MFS transporter n=1 Tax=Dapis sp. BLCC M126 TaxID=3400189 RepID=UPI003CF5DB33
MQLSDSNLQKTTREEKQPKTKPISAASLAEKEPERGLLPVLKNGKFLTLWSGQVFSQLADKVYLVLMIAIIANQFQAADQTISGWVSAIMIAFTIPAVLFGAGAGVYVDRWPKKAVLVVTNIIRGGLVLILPIVLWLSNDFHLGNLPLGFCLMLLLTFLVSTLTQFFAPAEQAVIPLIVEKRHLLSANSLYTTTMMASVIIGFAVGDPLLEFADNLVAKIGFGEALGKELVVGGSYAIAGLLLILLKTGEQKDLTEKEQPHILEDLRDGLRYLKNHHRVRNAIIQQIVLFSIFAALAVLAVRLAEIIPGMEAEEFGLLLAAAGVGMGIGAGMVGQLGHWFSHFQLSMIGSTGMAVSLVGLSIFNQEFWVAMVLIGILGMFGAVVGVPMQTTVQAETPEEMRGKVFGLQNNAVNIALSLPLALVGVAETFLGLSTVLLGLAGAAIIAGIFFSFFSTPTFE